MKHLRKAFLGEKGKNIWPFSAVIFLNFIAALFEGFSFTFILFAIGELSAEKKVEAGTFSSWMESCFRYFHWEQTFTLFIALAVSMQILRSVTSYIGQYWSLIVGIQIQTDLQKKIYGQILKLSFACVNRYKSGDLLEYAKMPAAITMPLITNLNGVIVSALMVLSSLAMMTYLSAPLTLLVVLTFGTVNFVQKWVIRRIAKISQALSDHIVDFSKQTVQSLNGLRVIHTFCRQNAVMRRVANTLENIAMNTKRITLWSNIIPSFNEVTGVSLVAFFLICGQWLLTDAAIPLLLTFVVILYRLNTRTQLLLSHLSGFANTWGNILRVEEILDDRDKTFIPHRSHLFPGLKESIALRFVSLQYENTAEAALKDVDTVIEKGKTVAFVGSSGAGKSSLLDILLELYEPTQGSVLVDGVDLRTYRLDSWRDRIGMVSQDSFIFNDTIEENIRFGKLDASLEEIQRASEWADAHGFISRLPDGYQTVLGERGYRLSGGQRQRIALARALVRNPEILILDEATSNLDSESEREIQKALEQLYGHKTIIIVAHRLSTIFHADRIVVLENGKLIEMGNHQELLEKNGKYASLWNIQSQRQLSAC